MRARLCFITGRGCRASASGMAGQSILSSMAAGSEQDVMHRKIAWKVPIVDAVELDVRIEECGQLVLGFPFHLC